MHVAPATRPPHAQSSTPTDAEHHGHDDRVAPAYGPAGSPSRRAIDPPGQGVASIDAAPDRRPGRLEPAPDLTRHLDGVSLSAALVGFERWARDRMSRRPDPTPAELAEREAIQDAWQRKARQEEQDRWARDDRADAFL